MLGMSGWLTKPGAGRVTHAGSGSRVVRLELALRRLEIVERLLAGLPAAGIVALPERREERCMCFCVGRLFVERLLILVEVYSVYCCQQCLGELTLYRRHRLQPSFLVLFESLHISRFDLSPLLGVHR